LRPWRPHTRGARPRRLPAATAALRALDLEARVDCRRLAGCAALGAALAAHGSRPATLPLAVGALADVDLHGCGLAGADAGTAQARGECARRRSPLRSAAAPPWRRSTCAAPSSAPTSYRNRPSAAAHSRREAHGEVLAQLRGPGAPVPIGVDDCVPRAAVNGARAGAARAPVTPAKRRPEG
jgi:hypothetical protein